MSFTDKVVIVTGGSSGIGAATALNFSKEGAKVVIVGRNKNKLEKVKKQCEESGNKPLVIIADVSNDADMNRVLNDTITNFGKLDILVNNAGVGCFSSIMSDSAIQEFDRTIAVNLRSAVYLTHLAVPYLLKTKGNIVNISSIGSTSAIFENNFAYCTSKAGLDHFTRSVALELASHGVRVNTINPGPVKTDYLHVVVPDETKHDEFNDMITKRTALGKQSEPNEIADLILYVASEKAKSITGSSFVIDNGMLLKC